MSEPTAEPVPEPTAEPAPAAEPVPVIGWSLLLAPGWWHVALNQRRHHSVRALVDRALAGRPKDAVAALRRALTAQFDDLVDRAAQSGASDVYLYCNPSHGLPVGATCVVTLIPRPLPADVPAGMIAESLTASPDDVPGVLVVAGVDCPAVARRDPGTGQLPDSSYASAAPDDLAAALPSARLEVYVPFPDRSRTLLLTFTTHVPEPAQDAMLTLFEAMAESLRWTTEPDSTKLGPHPT
jgi:hypothetical protein